MYISQSKKRVPLFFLWCVFSDWSSAQFPGLSNRHIFHSDSSRSLWRRRRAICMFRHQTPILVFVLPQRPAFLLLWLPQHLTSVLISCCICLGFHVFRVPMMIPYCPADSKRRWHYAWTLVALCILTKRACSWLLDTHIDHFVHTCVSHQGQHWARLSVEPDF